MIGFTYNGIHCSEFGLYYIPTREDQWFSDPEYEVYDADVDWRHGGFYYDSKAKVRKFVIKCYFEEIDVATRQAIKNWVRRDSSGTLIFDDMPFVYWNVRPGKIPVGNWCLDNNDTHSGTVDFTFNAYEPFGYLLRKSNADGVHDNFGDYCNLIDQSEMPPEPTTSSTSFDVYNPGTEDCGLSIEMIGTTTHPFRFYNNTNKTQCVFEALPPGGLCLLINGETGYVSKYVYGTDNITNAFEYHDKGVIKLSPNFGRSGLNYRYFGKNGSLYGFTLDGYIATNRLLGATVKISGLNNTFIVEAVSLPLNRIYCSTTGSPVIPTEGTCSLKTVNSISIQEKVNNSWVVPTTLSFSHIGIDYNPRAL